jgi:hypothetical protein
MTIILSRDEKDLLDNIMDDKFQAGAFCGMIFNALVEEIDAECIKDVETQTPILIKAALNVRLIAYNMSK